MKNNTKGESWEAKYQTTNYKNQIAYSTNTMLRCNFSIKYFINPVFLNE